MCFFLLIVNYSRMNDLMLLHAEHAMYRYEILSDMQNGITGDIVVLSECL